MPWKGATTAGFVSPSGG